MFLRISLNSCPQNLLLVRSHQAEIINYCKASYPRMQQHDQDELNPDHLIGVIKKTTPLPIRPRCRHATKIQEALLVKKQSTTL